MAITTSAIWQVLGGAGSDTLCSGAFDPSLTAGMLTDLAATGGTGNSPVLTSAGYPTTAAGDVGNWVYIVPGGNWRGGWFKVLSQNGTSLTVDATAGNWVTTAGIPSTVAGVATTASPTGGTWTIDYSQTASAIATGTHGAAAQNSTTFTDSTAAAFKPVHVGNAIYMPSGTNIVANTYFVATYTDASNVVLDRACATAGAGSAGTWKLGGALATLGRAGQYGIGGNDFFLTGNTTQSSSSLNVASGVFRMASGTAAKATRVIGYGTVRGDRGTRPVITQTIASSTNGVFTDSNGTNAMYVENIEANANSQTSTPGFVINTGHMMLRLCKASNAPGGGFIAGAFNGSKAVNCAATGCGTAGFQNVDTEECDSYSNTGPNYIFGSGGGHQNAVRCVSRDNTGSTSDGIQIAGGSCTLRDCVSRNSGRHGFYITASTDAKILINCIASENAATGAYGYEASAPDYNTYFYHCASYNNQAGDYDAANFNPANIRTFISLNNQPFNAPSASPPDFSLNNVGGNSQISGGRDLRSAGFGSTALSVIPGLATLGYSDIGAQRHKDPLIRSNIAGLSRI